jgi:UNC-50 family
MIPLFLFCWQLACAVCILSDPLYFSVVNSDLSVSAMAWSVVYSYSLLEFVKLALLMILRDYLCVGVVVATILWLVLHYSFPGLKQLKYVQGGFRTMSFCLRHPTQPQQILALSGLMPSTSIRTLSSLYI